MSRDKRFSQSMCDDLVSICRKQEYRKLTSPESSNHRTPLGWLGQRNRPTRLAARRRPASASPNKTSSCGRPALCDDVGNSRNPGITETVHAAADAGLKLTRSTLAVWRVVSPRSSEHSWCFSQTVSPAGRRDRQGPRAQARPVAKMAAFTVSFRLRLTGYMGVD